MTTPWFFVSFIEVALTLKSGFLMSLFRVLGAGVMQIMKTGPPKSEINEKQLYSPQEALLAG